MYEFSCTASWHWVTVTYFCTLSSNPLILLTFLKALSSCSCLHMKVEWDLASSGSSHTKSKIILLYFLLVWVGKMMCLRRWSQLEHNFTFILNLCWMMDYTLNRERLCGSLRLRIDVRKTGSDTDTAVAFPSKSAGGQKKIFPVEMCTLLLIMCPVLCF